MRLGARLRQQGVRVEEIVYPQLGHRTLIAALASALRAYLAPVLDNVAHFVNEVSAQ